MRRNIDRLVRYLEARAGRPHAWGRRKNDCVSFCAGAVSAQTGRNPLGELSWSSERTAIKLVKRLGGMEAALDARLTRIAPAQAMRGDIAGVPDERFGLHPMVVEGATLVSPGERGPKRMPRSAMVAAWSAVDWVRR